MVAASGVDEEGMRHRLILSKEKDMQELLGDTDEAENTI